MFSPQPQFSRFQTTYQAAYTPAGRSPRLDVKSVAAGAAITKQFKAAEESTIAPVTPKNNVVDEGVFEEGPVCDVCVNKQIVELHHDHEVQEKRTVVPQREESEDPAAAEKARVARREQLRKQEIEDLAAYKARKEQERMEEKSYEEKVSSRLQVEKDQAVEKLQRRRQKIEDYRRALDQQVAERRERRQVKSAPIAIVEEPEKVLVDPAKRMASYRSELDRQLEEKAQRKKDEAARDRKASSSIFDGGDKPRDISEIRRKAREQSRLDYEEFQRKKEAERLQKRTENEAFRERAAAELRNLQESEKALREKLVKRQHDVAEALDNQIESRRKISVPEKPGNVMDSEEDVHKKMVEKRRQNMELYRRSLLDQIAEKQKRSARGPSVEPVVEGVVADPKDANKARLESQRKYREELKAQIESKRSMVAKQQEEKRTSGLTWGTSYQNSRLKMVHDQQRKQLMDHLEEQRKIDEDRRQQRLAAIEKSRKELELRRTAAQKAESDMREQRAKRAERIRHDLDAQMAAKAENKAKMQAAEREQREHRREHAMKSPVLAKSPIMSFLPGDVRTFSLKDVKEQKAREYALELEKQIQAKKERQAAAKARDIASFHPQQQFAAESGRPAIPKGIQDYRQSLKQQIEDQRKRRAAEKAADIEAERAMLKNISLQGAAGARAAVERRQQMQEAVYADLKTFQEKKRKEKEEQRGAAADVRMFDRAEEENAKAREKMLKMQKEMRDALDNQIKTRREAKSGTRDFKERDFWSATGDSAAERRAKKQKEYYEALKKQLEDQRQRTQMERAAEYGEVPQAEPTVPTDALGAMRRKQEDYKRILDQQREAARKLQEDKKNAEKEEEERILSYEKKVINRHLTNVAHRQKQRQSQLFEEWRQVEAEKKKAAAAEREARKEEAKVRAEKVQKEAEDESERSASVVRARRESLKRGLEEQIAAQKASMQKEVVVAREKESRGDPLSKRESYLLECIRCGKGLPTNQMSYVVSPMASPKEIVKLTPARERVRELQAAGSPVKIRSPFRKPLFD